MNLATGEARGRSWPERFARLGAAVILTFLLLAFLIASRRFEQDENLLTIRAVSGTDPVAMPTPPPPPPQAESQPVPPPPPTATMELPELELSINELAPPIEAAMAANQFDFTMKPADFSTYQPVVKARSLYAASDLDDQPRLLNRPRVAYPASQLSAGVNEGRVTLEVLINVSGKVTVRRVVSNSHPDFISMAKNFANQALFTSPKKDGRIVNAVFNWPLVLRP
jgi:outer membrane biosynthesis protein TonB